MRVVDAYLKAKKIVIDNGFATEIDWQDSVSNLLLRESDFLREAAWVILSSGMKEKIIRQKFGAISKSFFSWKSSKIIIRKRKICRVKALLVFNNSQKIDAIIYIANHVAEIGFQRVKKRIALEEIDYIRTFPFMGPVTAFHFAKNIGLDVVKPDRHLMRVANITGYESPDHLCRTIAQIVGDKLSVIDIVIWRYATFNRDYLKLFA